MIYFWIKWRHNTINVLKSLSEKKTAVVGLVVCSTMATCIEAIDVPLAAGQCTVCLSHSLEKQAQFHLASGIYLVENWALAQFHLASGIYLVENWALAMSY